MHRLGSPGATKPRQKARLDFPSASPLLLGFTTALCARGIPALTVGAACQCRVHGIGPEPGQWPFGPPLGASATLGARSRPYGQGPDPPSLYTIPIAKCSLPVIRLQRGSLSFEPRQKKGRKENLAAQAPRGLSPATTTRRMHRIRSACGSQCRDRDNGACARRGRVVNLAYGYATRILIGVHDGAPAKDRLTDPRGSGALPVPRLERAA